MEGIVRFFVREIARVRGLPFERTQEGAIFYVPGGTDNPLARRCYLVPDEETVRTIEARERPWFRAGLAGLAVLVVAMSSAVILRPTGVSLVAVIAAFAAAVGLYAWAPVVIGRRIARSLHLPLRERPRSLKEISVGVTRLVGSDDTPWRFTVGVLAVCMGLGWMGYEMVERGEEETAIFFAVLLAPVIGSVPFHLVGVRTRRAARENERLEAVVRERTSQLREVHRELEARVAEQVKRLERLGQLRHFFAAPVAERILDRSGFDPAVVHRKEISAVSIDLRGFTAFAEVTEPEDVIAVLRRYHTRLGELVNRHEATLEHFAGENAMVFLNDPLDAPDHPRRAITLACELRDAVQPLLEEWRRDGHDLGLAVGIASGYATIGTVGYEGRWEYAAIGSVCNLAARLCGAAQDGQVLTTHRVLSRAGGAPRTEPVGELAMKGISRPVAGFNVLSLA